MFLTESGTAMMSIDRHFGQFSVEIKSNVHWWPVFMLRVGKGTARIDATMCIKDGLNARRFPQCYATSPDGLSWHSEPGMSEEASTMAARAALELEAKEQLATIKENIHRLIEAIDCAYTRKSPLILVRRRLERGDGYLFEPRERLSTNSNACLKGFAARSSEAYRTGWALVVAQRDETSNVLAYAKIKPGDLLLMRKFLELVLAFRDMEQVSGV